MVKHRTCSVPDTNDCNGSVALAQVVVIIAAVDVAGSERDERWHSNLWARQRVATDSLLGVFARSTYEGHCNDASKAVRNI